MHGVRVLHSAQAALGDCTLEGNEGHALEAGDDALVEGRRCRFMGALLRSKHCTNSDLFRTL
jgi:hypothetical protein